MYSIFLYYEYFINIYYLLFMIDFRNFKLILFEFFIYYLLFYNLSMIFRYEIDWWYDLFGSYGFEDYLFIY